MTSSFLQSIFADRIGGGQFGKEDVVYKFAKIRQAKVAALKARPDLKLIDMGVGEPDGMADALVIESLRHECQEYENRIYADNGCSEFREAAADYMHRLYGVELDPDAEVLHCVGAKAALAILPTCFVDPDDVVLLTVPGYPVFGTHSEYYGGDVYPLELREENGFLPDLDSIPVDIVKRSKVLVLNYPNNPTGAVATKAFYEKVIAWAKLNEVVIVQDAAYGALVYDGKPLSILQVPGAKDVAIELHSLSKSHNMTGWRMGWVCGNPLLVKAYGEVKANTDSGQFLAIQKAAALGLRKSEITKGLVYKYQRRMDLMLRVFKEVGFSVRRSPATFFLYCKSPRLVRTGDKEYTFNTAEDFSHWLITEQLVSTVPWDDAGAFVRFSLTYEAKTEADELDVMEELKRRLGHYEYIF